MLTTWPASCDRETIRGWIEDATGDGLSVADPLPDTLLATAQELNLAPIELRIWAYGRFGDMNPPAETANHAEALARWAAQRAYAICGHCGEAVSDGAAHECPPKEAA
jgi:hypothetical protein